MAQLGWPREVKVDYCFEEVEVVASSAAAARRRAGQGGDGVM
jgi:hypothetical protein